MDGKHAQMIPTFVSMAESIAAGGLSKVGSGLLETETRVCSRMIDTRHTLQFVLVLDNIAITWFHLQSSKTEDNNECSLLSFRYVEALQNRHGKKQDDNILCNVDAGIGKPNGLLVEALSIGDGLVPEESDGKAEEDAS